MQLGSPIYGTTKPEDELTRLMENDFGVWIAPQALRMFIRFRWQTISKLAHDIHDSAPHDQTPAEYRAEVIKAELQREANRPTLDPDEIARRYRAGEFDPK